MTIHEAKGNSSDNSAMVCGLSRHVEDKLKWQLVVETKKKKVKGNKPQLNISSDINTTAARGCTVRPVIAVLDKKFGI